MSVTFSIANTQKKGGLFSFGQKSKVMSADEILAFAQSIHKQFCCYSDFEEDEQQQAPLNTLDDDLVLGIGQHTLRGFELSANENGEHYYIRVNTPAGIGDWQAAILFMQALAKKMKSDIIDEDGQTYQAENIPDFDYMTNIEFGLKSVLQTFQEDNDLKTCRLMAAQYHLDINRQRVESYFQQENPLQAFSDDLTALQNMDLFQANQIMMLSPQQELIGYYTLTSTVPTILKRQPSIEVWNQHITEQYGEVQQWLIALVLLDEEKDNIRQSGMYDYQEFMQKLPAQYQKPFDDGQMIVEMDIHAMQDFIKQLTPVIEM